MIVYSFYRTDGDYLELIMINSEKIKIMLTREDMLRYDIRMYSLGHTGSAIKEAFSEVLADIKERTGFDTLSSKTILQVYPSRDGGCEVYITRLSAEGSGRMHTDRFTDEQKHSETKITIRRWCECVIFAFENITDVMDACQTLKAGGYDKSSSLHRCGDSYYLLLETEMRPKGSTDELTKISDFGKRISGKITEAYIYEHGEMIINAEAVEALARG